MNRVMMLAATVSLLAAASTVRAQSVEDEVIRSAAVALGGLEQVRAVKSVRIAGEGQLAYHHGGGNASGSPTAPQKWVNINGAVRSVDLVNWRMDLTERQFQDFVFAYARNMTTGRLVHQVVDGEVAYSVDEDGHKQRLPAMAARALRIEMLRNPLAIVRLAMEPETRLSGLHREEDYLVMALITPWGDKLELGVDALSRLPAWLRWSEPQENLGELTNTGYFNAYQPWRNGRVLMPTGYNVISDWRHVAQSKLYVDMTDFDVDLPDLAAPAVMRSGPAPVRQMHAEAQPVAKGVWLIHGEGGANSILFEFSDHLTLFEVPSSSEWTKLVLERARRTVPGKPVTEAIVSHHHFDHSGGVREAVSQGITLITHPGNIGIFREMVNHPAPDFPDDQQRHPGRLKVIPVEDHLVLKDGAMEVDVYTVIAMNHMPHGVLAYVPAEKLLVQGDLFDHGWDIMWWGNAYMDNVRFRQLDVERDVPVHGIVLPLAQVRSEIAQQVRNAQALCKRVVAAGMSLQGCPVRAIPAGTE